jgi:hypothetical protein
MSIRHLEVDSQLIWSHKFSDFAKDIVRYNLDDNEESLTLYIKDCWKVINSDADASGDGLMPITRFLSRLISSNIIDIFGDDSS